MDEIDLKDDQQEPSTHDYYMKYTTNDSPQVTRYIPIIRDGETHPRYHPNHVPVDVNENEAPPRGNGVGSRVASGVPKRQPKPKSALRESYDQLLASFTSSG